MTIFSTCDKPTRLTTPASKGARRERRWHPTPASKALAGDGGGIGRDDEFFVVVNQVLSRVKENGSRSCAKAHISESRYGAPSHTGFLDWVIQPYRVPRYGAPSHTGFLVVVCGVQKNAGIWSGEMGLADECGLMLWVGVGSLVAGEFRLRPVATFYHSTY